MQSYYSCYGSPLQLILEDDVADAYNRAVQAFLDAQVDHRERTGSNWTPDQPLLMNLTVEEKNAHKGVGDVIRLLVEINGGGLDIPEEQTTSDFLIKLDL